MVSGREDLLERFHVYASDLSKRVSSDIRGLDKPFAVRVAQHYDAKSGSTVFDVEIAGTRTMLAHRWGRFKSMSPIN